MTEDNRPTRSAGEYHEMIKVLEHQLLVEITSQLEQCWHRNQWADDSEIKRLRGLIQLAYEAAGLAHRVQGPLEGAPP
jgi:hypothetical protein